MPSDQKIKNNEISKELNALLNISSPWKLPGMKIPLMNFCHILQGQACWEWNLKMEEISALNDSLCLNTYKGIGLRCGKSIVRKICRHHDHVGQKKLLQKKKWPSQLSRKRTALNQGIHCIMDSIRNRDWGNQLHLCNCWQDCRDKYYRYQKSDKWLNEWWLYVMMHVTKNNSFQSLSFLNATAET